MAWFILTRDWKRCGGRDHVLVCVYRLPVKEPKSPTRRVFVIINDADAIVARGEESESSIYLSIFYSRRKKRGRARRRDEPIDSA